MLANSEAMPTDAYRPSPSDSQSNDFSVLAEHIIG